MHSILAVLDQVVDRMCSAVDFFLGICSLEATLATDFGTLGLQLVGSRRGIP